MNKLILIRITTSKLLIAAAYLLLTGAFAYREVNHFIVRAELISVIQDMESELEPAVLAKCSTDMDCAIRYPDTTGDPLPVRSH